MIVLEREEPRILAKIEALKPRINPNHPKLDIMNRDYASFKAGFQGEKKVDYYLSLLDQDKFDIYQGIRLFNGKTYYQIDALVTSNNFIITDEIKNLTGTIIYDKKNNQFTQNEKPITNPFSQVKLQKLQFVDWLQTYKFSPIPIDFLITMANPATKIESPFGTPDNYWNLGYGYDLIEKIQVFERSFKKEAIPLKERKRLRKLLLKYHTPLDIDILSKYEISITEVKPGVQCPLCLTIPMIHTYGTWECLICHHKSKNAHIKAVQDYFLIFGPTITNQQFREFTLIQSRQLASRLLAEMNLTHTGINKGRVYYSTPFIPQETIKG
ncbi:nuclease-related domain-containing protein [Pseudoneobacillus sp. C159]